MTCSIESIFSFRPKSAAPLPDSTALRRMQNRWETEISQREVPKTVTSERSRNRWEKTDDTQPSSVDSNGPMTASQGTTS